MRKMRSRQRTLAGVSQICWMAPGPSISASVQVSPASMRIEGEIFQRGPRPRAWTAPVPSVAWPPPPLAPEKFSGEMERVLADESR